MTLNEARKWLEETTPKACYAPWLVRGLLEKHLVNFEWMVFTPITIPDPDALATSIIEAKLGARRNDS